MVQFASEGPFLDSKSFKQSEETSQGEFKFPVPLKKVVLFSDSKPVSRWVFSGRFDPFYVKKIECPVDVLTLAFVEWFVRIKYDHETVKPHLNREILSSRNHPPTLPSFRF